MPLAGAFGSRPASTILSGIRWAAPTLAARLLRSVVAAGAERVPAEPVAVPPHPQAVSVITETVSAAMAEATLQWPHDLGVMPLPSFLAAAMSSERAAARWGRCRSGRPGGLSAELPLR